MTDHFVGVEKLSEAEQRFERARKSWGLVVAPLVFTVLLLVPMGRLSPEAHRLAAVMAAVIVLWLTEALPLPVTGMVGAAACVVLRVGTAKEVFAPFADPLIFLFIGSFILARAIFLHGLDRRLAFWVLSMKGVGASPGRILFAFGAVTALLSAWISNTATTAMMFAIGLSILTFLFEQEEQGGPRINRRYATGLMLMTAFAASIGGLATPIGTPPNLIGLATIRRQLGVEIPFFQFMLIGVPIVLVLYVWMAAYLNYFCSSGVKEIKSGVQMLQIERARIGGWTRGQVSTVVAFAVTAALWVTPGVVALVAGSTSETYLWLNRTMPEGVAAVIGAMLLFLLPGNIGERKRAIDWTEAAKIDWGVVLLYGGGLALGILAERTGLAAAVGHGLAGLLPVGGSTLVMLIAATAVATMVSETTSNTASATIIVPVVIAIAQGAGIDPLEPALGATLGASLGFMLPVSTPCNAIVYGSGFIPIARMVQYGFLLDVVGIAVVVTAVRLLAPLVQ